MEEKLNARGLSDPAIPVARGGSGTTPPLGELLCALLDLSDRGALEGVIDPAAESVLRGTLSDLVLLATVRKCGRVKRPGPARSSGRCPIPVGVIGAGFCFSRGGKPCGVDPGGSVVPVPGSGIVPVAGDPTRGSR